MSNSKKVNTSDQNARINRTPFEIEQFALREWPFTFHRIERTLDPVLIEARAKQQLFQALNSRNLVVFAGSGLSSAYGRLGWIAWQDRQVGVIGRLANAYLACAEKSLALLKLEVEFVRELSSRGEVKHGCNSYSFMEKISAVSNDKPQDVILKCMAEHWSSLSASSAINQDEGSVSWSERAPGTLNMLGIKQREIDSRSQEIRLLNSTFCSLVKESAEVPLTFQCAAQLLSLIHASSPIFLAPVTSLDSDELADDKEPHRDSRIGFGKQPDVPKQVVDDLCDLVPWLDTSALSTSTTLTRTDRIFSEADSENELLQEWIKLSSAACEYQLALNRFWISIRSRDARLSLHEMAKVLLVDECAHAEDIVRNMVDYDEDRGRQPWRQYLDSCKDKEQATAVNNSLRKSLKATEQNNLRRDIQGIRDNKERYGALGFFTTEGLMQVVEYLRSCEHVNDRWSGVLDSVDYQLQENVKPSRGRRWSVDRTFVSPTHRYVLEMLMTLVPDPYSSFRGWPGSNDSENELDNESRPWIRRDLGDDEFKSRLSLIDGRLDPVAKLVGDLGIRRFMTVNYDFEIERYFQDVGYNRSSLNTDQTDKVTSIKQPLADEAFRTDGTGAVLHDHEFIREKSPELVTFSVDHERDEAGVFHLHGRADMKSRLVVTETDYTDLYLRNDRYRESVDESIRVAFSANPLLFVGVGMTEADVLRPLRQFISDKGGASGRTAFVLFAADKSASKCAERAASLYLRYGVHVIHYGMGRIQFRPSGDEECTCEIDWLNRVLRLIEELRQINEQWHGALHQRLKMENPLSHEHHSARNNADTHGAQAGRNQYESALETLQSSEPETKDSILKRLAEKVGQLDVAGQPKYALELLIGKPITDSVGEVRAELLVESLRGENRKNTGSGRLGIVRFAECLFPGQDGRYNVRSDKYLRFEYELLAQLLQQTVIHKYPDLPEWKDTGSTGPSPGNHSAESQSSAERTLRAATADTKARLVALDGLKSSLLTATLCIALEGLDRARREWWKWWLISPPHRGAFFDRDRALVATSDKRSESLPIRFVRHWPDPANTSLAPDVASDLDADAQKTTIRAYEDFLNAVRQRLSMDVAERTLGKGRRQYCVLSPRGQGKGAFFSAFVSLNGMRRYVDIMSIAAVLMDGNRAIRPRYCACIYANLCYATEIASNYDMLVDALRHAMLRAVDEKAHPDSVNASNDDQVDEIISQFDKARTTLSRIALLRLAFDTFAQISEQVMNRKGQSEPRQPRFMLCINAIELLHYDEGIPKNREIEEILMLISGRATRKYPFDLVLLTSESRVSELFRNNTEFNQRYDREVRNPDSTSKNLKVRIKLEPENRENRSREISFNLAANRTPFITILRPTEHIAPSSKLHSIIENVTRRQLESGIATQPLQRELDNDGGVYVPTCSLKKMRIVDETITDSATSEKHRQLTTDDVAFAYFIRVLQPNHLLCGTFLPLAYFLYVYFVRRQIFRVAEKCLEAGVTNFEKIMPRSCLTVNELESGRPMTMGLLEKAWARIDTKWNHEYPGLSVGLPELQVTNKSWQPGLFAAINRRQNEAVVRALSRMIRLLSQALKEFEQNTDLGNERAVCRRYFSEIRDLLTDPPDCSADKGTFDSAVRFLEHRYDTGLGEADQREWHQVRILLRGNRYCMTLLLAAAQRIALSGRTIIDGAELAEDFIHRTTAKAKAVTEAERENIILAQVFDAYQRFHVKGDARCDMDLHRLIIRHLGVIGVPCSADVLVRAPAIRLYFGEIVEESEVRRYSRLVKAMSELVDRGLIFRLKPNYKLRKSSTELQAGRNSSTHDNRTSGGSGAKDSVRKSEGEGKYEYIFGNLPGEHEFRYTLHRLLQRFIVSTMGAGPREFVEINSFAPSLHASMPSDLPRLTHEAYGFMSSLVATLSQYPDQQHRMASSESWHLSGAPLSTQVQALRSAMSAIRSVFSIAVVSRFEEYIASGELDKQSPRGFFEEYRVQVRWLIRKAAYLLYPSIDPDDYRPEREHQHLVAFYRDEIVWLYNECGVINLVQGNVPDAIDMFNQAISLNRQIEGRSDGAQYNRIALNLSLGLIERGKLNEARELLAGVSKSEKQYARYEGRVWHIAQGYRGLLEQIGGDPMLAGQQLDQAIRGLRVYKDSRASAVFLRHRADLHRFLGELEESQNCIEQSINFAQNGGHEDLHQISRLARVRLDLRLMKDRRDYSGLGSLVTRINVIENYALTMEMPSLLCETYSVRAAILLDQGDLSQSGYLFAQAMILAKRNGMALRLNFAVTGYASVLHRRGLTHQARMLLGTSLEMAKRNHSQIEIGRVEAMMEEIENQVPL